jgi:hypothetical protein
MESAESAESEAEERWERRWSDRVLFCLLLLLPNFTGCY